MCFLFEILKIIHNFIQNHIIMLLNIGESIKRRRKALKITQPYLADLAEVSVNTIFKIESGEANPTIEVITKIADVLGMKIQLVIKNINEPEDENS